MMRPMKPTPAPVGLRLVPAVVLLLLASPPARADDWPQWLGPRRDGVWRETGILDKFPEPGPKVRWRVPVGGGYAGPAVAGGRVFVMDWTPDKGAGAGAGGDAFQRRKQRGVERVLCLNESDGKLIWEHKYDCEYGISYASGPRVTPAVDGKHLYSLGAEGHLRCLTTDSGKLVWEKRLGGPEKGETPTPIWGFATHPLVDGDKVICLTGRPDGIVAAFNKLTGEELWSAVRAKGPGYCPPMIHEAAGRRQLIVWHPESVNSLDPETGKVYWSVPWGPVRFGVAIATPRFIRDPKLGELLLVSSEGEGAMMLKLAKGGKGEPSAAELWRRTRKPEGLHLLMSTATIRAGHAYGVSHGGRLRCVKVDTGDVVWETFQATTGTDEPDNWATAFLIPLGEDGAADAHRFFIPNERGDLIIADLSPTGYRELDRAHLLEPTNPDAGRPVLWCHPAFANRSMYWRNDREMICVSLAADGS